MIIQYRNPQRPDEGAIRFIPNRSEIDAEKQRLERLGFVIIDISTPDFTRHHTSDPQLLRSHRSCPRVGEASAVRGSRPSGPPAMPPERRAASCITGDFAGPLRRACSVSLPKSPNYVVTHLDRHRRRDLIDRRLGTIRYGVMDDRNQKNLRNASGERMTFRSRYSGANGTNHH